MVDPPPLVRPTPGPVRAGFRYDPAHPFAAGQRRGIRFTVAPGAPVVAPCRGRVTFAGRTPRGGAVTVRCGRWSVALSGVAATVRAGVTVPAGRAIASASGAVVGLSVRPAVDRWGYVDPAPLLEAPAAPRETPLGPAPRPVGRGARRPAPAIRLPRRAPLHRPAPLGRAAPVARPAQPADRRTVVDRWAVGVGLALAALGLPALRRRRTVRRGPGSATRPWTDARATVPSIGNGLLRHDPDLLRQRRSAPRARVLDDRR